MIKKYFRTSLFVALSALMTCGFTACSDSDDDNKTEVTPTDNAKAMEEIADQYVNNTVNLTYKELAEQTGKLYDKLAAVTEKFKTDPNSVTQAEIDDICTTFKEARSEYEESEAFLFGAATDFGIDPHIDTWPLDADGLATALSNSAQVAKLDGEDGIAYASGKLGQELLGFHGIEFIIFRDGQNRTIEALRGNETDEAFAGKTVTGKEELIYATAVAGDLRDKCWQMEVSWNEDAPQAHIDRVEELELPYTVNGGEKSYGQNMLLASKAGSTYATWAEVMSTILISGCQNISNEVANVKIGNPYSGDDPNYIESPYSHMSFVDFKDNIISIQNSLYGGRDENGARNENKSIIKYMKDHNYENVTALETSLKEAIAALENCQSQLGSFVGHTTDALVGTAQTKVKALDTQLTLAGNWFATQK